MALLFGVNTVRKLERYRNLLTAVLCGECRYIYRHGYFWLLLVKGVGLDGLDIEIVIVCIKLEGVVVVCGIYLVAHGSYLRIKLYKKLWIRLDIFSYVFLTLTDPLAIVGEPRAALLYNVKVDTVVDYLARAGNSLAVENIKLSGLEGSRGFFFCKDKPPAVLVVPKSFSYE